MSGYSPEWPGQDQCPLFSATAARKRAEQDAMLLANRIRLLRQEEDKTKKKIRETEQKTQDIIELRRRNEERRLAKEAEDARREAEELEFRTRMNLNRGDHQQKIQDKVQALQERNAAISGSVRREREINKHVVEEQRMLEEAEALARAERIRETVQAVSKSRARSEGARQEAAKDAVRERLLREEDARRARLTDIERMEREEAELIARLQQSQERHRLAFMQLEDVLRQNGQPSVGGTPKAARLEFPSSEGRSASGSSGKGDTARPPRPRGLQGPQAAPAASATSQFVAFGSAPSGQLVARPASGRSSGRRPSAEGGMTPKPKQSLSCLSSCSTAASVAEGRAAENSGHSTPCSASAPQITYTTVDGLQLDIPPEEDLDLAGLLNSWQSEA